jgi:hypothetical protein
MLCYGMKFAATTPVVHPILKRVVYQLEARRVSEGNLRVVHLTLKGGWISHGSPTR